MKKRILIFLIILCCKHVAANDYKPYFAQFVSGETTIVNGTLYMHGFIKCTDTLNFVQQLSYQLPSGWSQINYQNYSSGSSNTLYMPGDSIPVVFTISYPTSAFPYYPVDLKIFAKIKTKYNDTLEARFHGKVFFTPWNTIETWAEEDFYSSGRVWKEEVLHGSQSRISIDKDSIPISDIGPNDTITEDWQYEARLVTYPGLPFYVKMKPIHPDTMKYYADNFGDSISSLSNQLNKADFRYIGNVTGTLSTTFINDNNQTNPLLLKGVLIKLIDRDGSNGNIMDVLDETHTDVNGNFTLSYNVWQPFESGELELELHVKAKNKDYKFEVLSKGGGKVLFGITEELAPFDLGSVGHNFSRSNVQLTTNDNAFKVCNWVFNAFHYCENQGILSKVIPNDKKLHIATNSGNSMMIPNNIKLLDMFTGGDEFFNPTIFLEEEDDEHENTLYHEWGHYMMWRMQGRNFITRLDKSQCLKNFGTHSWDEEQHIRMVWTEGFANAILWIMDAANWQEDNEYGLEEDGFTLETRDNTFTDINNGFRSEYFMACAMYDLWDGPDKGLPTGTNSIPGTTNHPFNDRLQTGGGIGNDWILEEDNISLSFNGLMRPIYENDGLGNGLKNIYEYVMYLMNVIYDNDCGAKSGIARCFRENRIVMDIDFYETITSTAGGNLLDRNTGFSSDNLFELKSFEDRVVNIGCIPSTDELFINQEIIEEIPNHICQLIPESNNITEILTDDLRLGYNFTNVSEISECRINTNSSLNMTAVLCSNVIYSINNTLFQIGNVNGQSVTKFHVNNEARFRLDPMAILRVNNNSKFIVEVGGTLEIFPGSRIILNGSNAILEIKGNLIVHDGATFTFEGGSQGSGHVIFNILDDPGPINANDHISLGVNSRIRLVGANNNDRVMEVPADAQFWPDVLGTANISQTFFEIENGFVAMGRDAVLNIGSRVNWRQARFFAESQSKAKGIVLWGARHTINGVIIENVRGGVESYNNYGGWQLIMLNVKVLGADRALYSEGKGTTLTNFESENNDKGIEIRASIGRNIFHSPKVNGAEYWGTFYTGNAASNLVINKANYFDNLEGVNFTSEGNLVLNCGKFHNFATSTGFANGNGITQSGGTFISTDALGFQGGRVSFADNKNTIHLSKSKFYLNNGYNDLSFIVTPSTQGINLALKGSSMHFTGSLGTINADNNLWDKTNSSHYKPITLGLPYPPPPYPYQNYNISCWIAAGPPGTYVFGGANFPDINFITPSTFGTEQTNRCITGSGTGSDKGTKATTKMITTTHFNNSNLQDAVGTVIDNMHNSTNPDYPVVINLWAELLTEVSYETPYSELDYYYIDLVENKMMESLGYLLSEDTTLTLSAPGLAHFQTVLAAQNIWINILNSDTTKMGKSLKNIFHFDKGSVYHMQGNGSSAQTQWTNMQSWANEQYLQHTDYWLCQLIREELIKNCGNNHDSLDNIPVCYYSDGQSAFRLRGVLNPSEDTPKVFELKPPPQISKHLTLYPNPASNSVTAELETSQKGSAIINIYSADGKCIKTISNIKLGLGINKLQILVSDFTPGVYSITIETRNIKWNEKAIIK